MSEAFLIKFCAPTMANIKTANLFSCPFVSREALINEVRSLNMRLKKKGIRVLALKFSEGRGLVYVYRPGRLSRDLQNCQACSLLRQFGYPEIGENVCLRHLIQRLEESSDFPHEIGLFLGYPPEDVYGFIHQKEACKLCGFWKVYGDVDKAKLQFARFRKCSELYWKQWQMGKSLEHLTVAA